MTNQQTNCRYSCSDGWRIRIEVNQDVICEKIETLKEELMERKIGKKLKIKALEWKKLAAQVTSVGGSSFTNIDRVVEELS